MKDIEKAYAEVMMGFGEIDVSQAGDGWHGWCRIWQTREGAGIREEVR